VRIPSIPVYLPSGAEGPFIYYLGRVFSASMFVNIPVSFYVNPSVKPSVKYSVSLLVSLLVNLLIYIPTRRKPVREAHAILISTFLPNILSLGQSIFDIHDYIMFYFFSHIQHSLSV